MQLDLLEEQGQLVNLVLLVLQVDQEGLDLLGRQVERETLVDLVKEANLVLLELLAALVQQVQQE